MGSESNIIRVYFCTAFRDMHAERAYLHEVVFPRLAQQFQERGYVFEAVDPRWSVQTEEEAEGFNTLEQSLDDIERCRPYFIGILGSNYGKVLLEVPDHIGRKHPGIKHYFRCSRVHLETLLGALREPQKAKNSFFLFRKPDFLNDVPDADKKTFLPNNAMEALNEVEAHKLEVFKGAISTTGLSIMEYDCRWDPQARKVTGLEDFGEKIAAAILSWIGGAERPVPRKATSLIGWSTPAPMPKPQRAGSAAAPAGSPFDETIPLAAPPERGVPFGEEVIPDAAAVVEEGYDVVDGDATEALPGMQAAPPVGESTEALAASEIPMAAPTDAGGDVDIESLLADEDVLSAPAAPPAPAAALPAEGADDMMAFAAEELAGSAAAPAQQTPPPYVDKNVQFSVFRPKVVVPDKWETLVAFAHLAEKAPDAPEEEPDPVEEVQRQAQQVLGQKAEDYVQVTKDSSQAVPREGELTFVPEVEGFEFNPPQRSFFWNEPVHREEFRMKATADMDGKMARGRLSVFLGSILLADVPLNIKVDSQTEMGDDGANMETTAAQAYRKIFASYSHKDTAIVEQFKSHAKALGDRYLQDIVDLRSGEDWNDRLKQLIGEADVFQLFWSSNSMHSPFVRQEWEHALKLMEKKKKPHFLRPTYWEDPLPEDPNEDLPPEPLRRLHFQRIVTLGPSTHPAGGGGGEDALFDMDTDLAVPSPMAEEAAVAEAEETMALEDDSAPAASMSALEEESDSEAMALEDDDSAVADLEEDAEMAEDVEEEVMPRASARASRAKKKGGSKMLIILLLLLVLLGLGGAAVYLFVLQ